VLIALLMLLVDALTMPNASRSDHLFVIAIAMSALYALGCGATLFAGEHDAGTFEFQRSLPVGAGRVFFAKMTFALLSTAAMYGLTWLLAFGMGGWRWPNPHLQREFWATFGFAGVEMFVWAAFFSLLTKRPLLSAVLGVATSPSQNLPTNSVEEALFKPILGRLCVSTRETRRSGRCLRLL